MGEWDLKENPDCNIDDPDDCADPPVDAYVRDIITHELYSSASSNQENDIALLRLTQPVRITPYVRPICLPVASHLRSLNYDGEILTVAGWGRTESGKLIVLFCRFTHSLSFVRSQT